MSTVRVRMYRQGLGDSFLLTFDTGDGPEHVLIDCGLLKGSPKPERIRQVAENVVAETGGKLDVLVATHEHWDHVSGFNQARDVFEQLEVGQVWVAWTEDPDDALAKELREKKKHALAALVAAERRLAATRDPGVRALASAVGGLLAFHGDIAADGRTTTRDGLEWVLGRQAELRYLRPGQLVRELGVRVHVLGPPHDRELIKRSDPSKKHPEVYHLAGDLGMHDGFLAAARGTTGDDRADRQPFDPAFRMTPRDEKAERLFKTGYDAPSESWRRIEDDWLESAGQLALHLDSDTNNTSLVLAFELEKDGPVLLFPGDAQVGNWLSWKDADLTGDLTSDELLARTVLYKVGHHGSHNATMRERGLELMTSEELVAMIPVNRVTAGKQSPPWKMPFKPLHDRLVEKTRGRILDAERGVARKPARVSEAEWKRFRKRTAQNPLWLDYTIEW